MKKTNKKYTLTIPLPSFIKHSPTFFVPQKKMGGGNFSSPKGRLSAPIPYVKGGYATPGYVIIE